MKKILISTFGFLLISVFTLPFVVSAQQELPKFQARVKIDVSADENIKEEVQSYLARELRSLNDVIIVDENPEWELSIIAMELSTKEGYKKGIGFSIVILKPFNFNHRFVEILKTLFGESISDKVELIDSLTYHVYSYEGHWLQTGPTDGLKSICQKIVVNFDSNHLEKSRKFYQQMTDSMKNQK